MLLFAPLLPAADTSAMTTAKPLSPAQALASLQVEHGLRVELAVAEPLTASPSAVAWDERGRMFVAENRGYPVGPGTNKPPVGIIAMLEDTNGDGTYDKRTEFATGLTFPNGLMCWRGGLIVTCAPDIFYLKDTDGDGKADVRRVLFTSFGTIGTTQLRVSHPTLGLDGYVHVTSGLVASKVTCPEHPERGTIDLPRGDARFHPDTLEIEPWPGVGQFGLAFDDFGRKFVCANRNPLQHVVLHPRYLKRNPHLAFSDTVQDVAPPGDAAKVWPLSADHTTAAFIPSLMSTPHAGTFTSACGISLWRGGALPAGFANSAFICEPAQNLVQRQVLTPDGPTFKSAPATPGREFLASADTWFRPVFSATGPDGALYICDMYRKVIDHPQYLPEHIRGTLDYEAGKTMGRIYRVTANPRAGKFVFDGSVRSASSKGTPKKTGFEKGGFAGWTLKLNSNNAWERDTAFRLLAEDGNPANMQWLKVVFETKQNSPAARVRVLRLLEARKALPEAMLAAAIGDSMSAVREAAAQIAELRLGQDQPGRLGEPLLKLTRDADSRARFTATLALGTAKTPAAQGIEVPKMFAGLATVATLEAGNRWTRAAVLSSSSGFASLLLREVEREVDDGPKGLEPLYYELGQLLLAESPTTSAAAVSTGRATVERELASILVTHSGKNARPELATAFATGLGNGARAKGLGKDGRSALVTLASANPDTARRLGELFAAASKTVATASAPTPERLAAVDLLAHSDAATAGAALQSLIAPQTPNELQATAVRALSQLPGAKAGEWFVERERWRSYTPPVRDAVLTAMLSQPALQLVLLEAVEKGVIQPWAVPANRRNPLLKHRDAAVAARATKAFQPQGAADRMKVYEDHKAVLALPANAQNGKAVFVKTCAACHQFAGEGARVGPELTGVRLQPAEAILLHIIVPDAEIYPGFTAYEAETKDGRSLTGLLASDTPTSVTLRAAQGVEETLLRANIAKLTSSSTSLMPNELEKTMTRQELADLMAFLKGQ
ncbi:MAG: c-type cytochrome [Verrucomicrobia bacterium]|nr:c-type cytochrome [Verrucomicrobiota bacterium]